MRVALLSQVQKRNNAHTVATMMEKTVAYRRQEVVKEAPMIAALKTRWPTINLQ